MNFVLRNTRPICLWVLQNLDTVAGRQRREPIHISMFETYVKLTYGQKDRRHMGGGCTTVSVPIIFHDIFNLGPRVCALNILSLHFCISTRLSLSLSFSAALT